MAVSWAAASQTVSLTRPLELLVGCQHGPIVIEERRVAPRLGDGLLVSVGLVVRRCPSAWASCRRSRWFSSASVRLRSLDVGTDVGLGVEPGSGDIGGAGEGLERDWRAGAVEFAKRADGLRAGQFVAPLGCGNQTCGVVRTHRPPPAAARGRPRVPR